jgi:hypothetical protein
MANTGKGQAGTEGVSNHKPSTGTDNGQSRDQLVNSGL